ncbi:DUF5682 family protein [Streptomyces sp. HSW2009]
MFRQGSDAYEGAATVASCGDAVTTGRGTGAEAQGGRPGDEARAARPAVAPDSAASARAVTDSVVAARAATDSAVAGSAATDCTATGRTVANSPVAGHAVLGSEMTSSAMTNSVVMSTLATSSTATTSSAAASSGAAVTSSAAVTSRTAAGATADGATGRGAAARGATAQGSAAQPVAGVVDERAAGAVVAAAAGIARAARAGVDDGAAPPVAPEGPFLLGIRHHGPGSARAVRTALDHCAPKAVLIEGPPEGDALLPLAADPDLRPPVALLAHVANEPGRAAFWPLAEFSPEWVAIQWALDHDVPVRFIDLPAAHTLALTDTEPQRPARAPGPDGPSRPEDAGTGAGQDTDQDGGDAPAGPATVRIDPLAVLADAAGYDDPERWWEDVVEHRGGPDDRPARGAAPASDPDTVDALSNAFLRALARGDDGHDGHATASAAERARVLAPFAAIGEAMAALRAAYGPGSAEQPAGPAASDEQPRPDRDEVREAHMRLRLREARREFGDEVAVVCGAWHVPALTTKATVAADRGLLRGLPKVKTELSWVPWTHRRLSRRSGYGAGITSPGWYGHLFQAPDRPVERWLTKVAGLLREEDYPVSTAHVIEAVRLADTLAVLRGRPLAGLTETTDAIRSVLCEGSDVPLALVHERLVVGDDIGEVPDSAPATPLQRDLARAQRALRLKPSAVERELELDLRKETDAERSVLLHRLALLGIDWGVPARGARTGTGTFRETWRLEWEPELAVRVAEAGIWGTTVHTAATARAEALAVDARALADVTELAERCLLAGLPDALPVVMRVLADRAALDADVGHLAQALPALVRSVRYGDVRGTDAGALGEVAAGLAERVCVGLPPACVGLDADGAAEMRGHVDAAHRAIGLLAETYPATPAAARGPRATPPPPAPRPGPRPPPPHPPPGGGGGGPPPSHTPPPPPPPPPRARGTRSNPRRPGARHRHRHRDRQRHRHRQRRRSGRRAGSRRRLRRHRPGRPGHHRPAQHRPGRGRWRAAGRPGECGARGRARAAGALGRRAAGAGGTGRHAGSGPRPGRPTAPGRRAADPG